MNLEPPRAITLYPTPDFVARAMLAAGREVACPARRILEEIALPHNNQQTIGRVRAYTAMAIHTEFPNIASGAISRMVGASRHNYFGSIQSGIENGRSRWFKPQALVRIIAAAWAASSASADVPEEGEARTAHSDLSTASDTTVPNKPVDRPNGGIIAMRQPPGRSDEAPRPGKFLRDRSEEPRRGIGFSEPVELPKETRFQEGGSQIPSVRVGAKARLEDELRRAVENTARMTPTK